MARRFDDQLTKGTDTYLLLPPGADTYTFHTSDPEATIDFDAAGLTLRGNAIGGGGGGGIFPNRGARTPDSALFGKIPRLPYSSRPRIPPPPVDYSIRRSCCLFTVPYYHAHRK